MEKLSMMEKMEKATEKEPVFFQKEQTSLRKYILNNFWIKVLSLMVAFLIWMVIVNIEDPYEVRNIVVSVKTINEDALSSVNKVYEVTEGKMATVKVKGKKSVVDRLKASDIVATANLANLSAVNAVAIEPRLVKKVSSKPILECKQVLKVELEDKAAKQVKVTVNTSGTPGMGYSVGNCISKPNMIEVSGGESTIRKIESVCVTIDVEGAETDFSKTLVPKAYDFNGEEVTSSTLRFSEKKVKIDVSILNTKSIPVNIKVTGEPANGYFYTSAECQPEKILIAGSAKSLQEIEGLDIPIDITGMKSASGSVEQNIIVQDYLPEGVEVMSDYAQVSLRIGIEKKHKRTLYIPVSDIKFSSLGSNYKAQILGNSDEVSVLLQGQESVIQNLSDGDYTAYIDCEGLKEGTYKRKVLLDLGGKCEIVKSVRVSVKIQKSKQNDEEETLAPEETETSNPDVTDDNE